MTLNEGNDESPKQNVQCNFILLMQKFKFLKRISWNLQKKKSHKQLIKESIKYQLFDFLNYIQNNLLNDSKNITENSFDNDDVAFGFHYHNYNFITKDVINENKFVFYYACKYDYFEIVNHFMNIKDFDINSKVEVCRKNDVFNCWFF